MLTNLNLRIAFVSSSILATLQCWLIMSAAVSTVADLLSPTRQFTTTSPPSLLATTQNITNI